MGKKRDIRGTFFLISPLPAWYQSNASLICIKNKGGVDMMQCYCKNKVVVCESAKCHSIGGDLLVGEDDRTAAPIQSPIS